MDPLFQQALLLAGETFLVCSATLLLFHLRGSFGLIPLAVFIGGNQYLQTILTATHYVEFGGYLVSPGSAVLFPSAIAAVLLIYLHDGVSRARALIWGIMLSNVILTALSYLTSVQIAVGGVANILGIPPEVFQVDARIFLLGTTILLLDVLLVLIAYELLFSRLRWLPLALRLPIALLLVLAFDTFAFVGSTLWGSAGFGSILASQLIAKSITGSVYGLLLFAYLRWYDRDGSKQAETVGTGVFLVLTYRERYDRLRRQQKTQELAFESEMAASRVELQALESRYRTLFETMSDGMLLVDGEAWSILEANSAFAEMCGREEEDLVGRSLASAELFSAQASEILGPRPSSAFETVLRRSAAEGVEVEIQVHRFQQEGRGILALLVRDIAARKLAERRTLLRMKERFISTVSHELRTPLTSIYGPLKLLCDSAEELPERARSFVDVAHRNAQRLSWLINEILEFQKIGSGMIRLESLPLDLRPLIHKSVEESAGFAEPFGVTIEVVGERSLWVEADRRWLQQVLTNLLSNAIKFSPEGGVVTVELESLGGRARVSVQDRGPGVPEDFRDQIFQPFSQAGGSEPRHKIASTGLGLSIAKAVVEQMEGRIGFESREGAGATFFFELPPVPAAEGERAEEISMSGS